MIDVLHIKRIEDLEDYGLAWRSLVEQTPEASFFHTLDWFKCYWEHYGTDQTLHVLIVREHNRPLGILPLVVRRESTRVGSIRVLTYPLHDWGSFYGPIGPNPTVALMAGLRYVAESRRNWDLLDLRWVDVDGIDRGRTERAMTQAGLAPMAQKWDATSVVEFGDDWQSYWDSRDRKFRKNVDRCERRLIEGGEMNYIRYRPEPAADGGGDPRWDLFDQCLGIAARSWQGESSDGTTLTHEKVCSFLRDAHEAAAHCGALDLNLLCVGGKPMAYAYNYVFQGRVYGLRKGYDNQYRTLRTGLALQKMMLEDGHKRGDRFYDLGVGSSESKESWQTGVAASYRFTYFPSTVLRAQFLRLNRLVRRRIQGEKDVACRH